MKNEAIQKVCETVYGRFPEFNGKKPKISSQSTGKYLLLFSATSNLPDGKQISQTIRVISDSQGQIHKISSSRG
ncbi:MAG: hypothetical protein MUO40_03145 [Anaerolineaceae bacterium]|nr:hypothetical protein [Anaerolineaceae bacterium]